MMGRTKAVAAAQKYIQELKILVIDGSCKQTRTPNRLSNLKQKKIKVKNLGWLELNPSVGKTTPHNQRGVKTCRHYTVPAYYCERLVERSPKDWKQTIKTAMLPNN